MSLAEDLIEELCESKMLFPRDVAKHLKKLLAKKIPPSGLKGAKLIKTWLIPELGKDPMFKQYMKQTGGKLPADVEEPLFDWKSKHGVFLNEPIFQLART